MSHLYALYLHLLMASGAPRLFERLLADPWYFGVLRGWADGLAIPAGARVLEMGCGPGRLSLHLAAGGAQVVGIDRAPGMVARAERRARREASSARFERTEVEAMAPGSRRFDWVIAASVLNVVERPPALLRAAVSLTRPGGHGAYLVPTPAMTRAAADAYAEQAGLSPFARAILRIWLARARKLDPQDLAGLLARAGYTMIRTDLSLNGMLASLVGQVSPSAAS